MGANAQTTVPTFTASQVLTADQMNQSARTGVPVFATTVERDAAFGGTGEKTLAEGQLCYLESTNVVQYYDGAAWATLGPSTSAVVQVKSTAKRDTFTTTSTTYTDVTGLSVAITPTSASNKVLIVAQVAVGGASSAGMGFFRLSGGNAATYDGDTAGNRMEAVFGGFANVQLNQIVFGYSMVYLDSPATTSATTYVVQTRTNATVGGTVYVNRSALDSDDAYNTRGASSITVFEVTP